SFEPGYLPHRPIVTGRSFGDYGSSCLRPSGHQIRECYTSALLAARRIAEAASYPLMKVDFFALERRWLSLSATTSAKSGDDHNSTLTKRGHQNDRPTL